MIQGQELIEESDVVVVTGGTGLFGHALQTVVTECGILGNWHYLSSRDCDLTDLEAVRECFGALQPTYVIHFAAYVGGLFRNKDPNQRIAFWLKNVNMNNNVLLVSSELNVKKCLSTLSTCVFPSDIPLPYRESDLFSAPPHQSNAPYAYAKRCLGLFGSWLNDIDHISTRYMNVIPCNLFGPYDNFNLQEGHVLPGLMHKCLHAKQNGTDFVVWGSGRPLRQFLYSQDAARMLLLVLFNYDGPEEYVSLTVGEENEVSIRQAAESIVKAFEFEGELVLDTSKSDGQFQKTTSNERFVSLFPDFEFTPFEDAIQETVNWFVENYDSWHRK